MPSRAEDIMKGFKLYPFRCMLIDELFGWLELSGART